MLRQAQHERSATPAWAVPVLERSIDPEFVTYDLHLLRATIQLVRSIMERSGPGELVIWVDDEDQVPDWARRALERFLPTFPISTLQGLPQSATELPDVAE